MDQYESIRTLRRVYGRSIREIARTTGHHRKTVRKALAGLEPQYRRRKPPKSPVMGPAAEIVAGWLREDRKVPRKQRHTARRIWLRLREEYGFEGAESTVRHWVGRHKAERGWGSERAVVPLDPEAAREAEADWGSTLVEMGGRLQRVKLFFLRSRYSGKAFVRAYPWERQEMFFDGHMRAFAHFGGVFPELVYDNLSSAVVKILKGKGRLENERFVSFRSHYTFKARFCNPGRGREKGGVENLVGYARRNFLVPIPRVDSFEELNALLEKRCLEACRRSIAGREDRRTVAERHEEERERLLALPSSPFENVKIVQVRISRYQTAMVDRNRYSVPRAWTGRRLWAHVGCARVSLYAAEGKVAEHARLFANCRWQLDPQHYLGLIGERIGSFEVARPIVRWRKRWPPEYEVLLSALRRRLGESRGTREFVGVLRLHADHPSERVRRAVAQAVERQAYGAATVLQLLRSEEKAAEPEPLPAEAVPGITDRPVPLPQVEGYDALLSEGGRP